MKVKRNSIPSKEDSLTHDTLLFLGNPHLWVCDTPVYLMSTLFTCPGPLTGRHVLEASMYFFFHSESSISWSSSGLKDRQVNHSAGLFYAAPTIWAISRTWSILLMRLLIPSSPCWTAWWAPESVNNTTGAHPISSESTFYVFPEGHRVSDTVPKQILLSVPGKCIQ